MKTIFTLFLALIIGNQTFATSDSTSTSISTPHYLGFHAGGTTGLGFSYRYWPSRWGGQITGIPIFGEDYSYGSIGLSALYNLRDNEKVDLFAYLGNHINYNTYNYMYYDDNGQVVNENVKYTQYNIGLGLGLDFKVFDQIHISAQGGYGLMDVTNSFSTFFTGEFGLYYNL